MAIYSDTYIVENKQAITNLYKEEEAFKRVDKESTKTSENIEKGQKGVKNTLNQSVNFTKKYGQTWKDVYQDITKYSHAERWNIDNSNSMIKNLTINAGKARTSLIGFHTVTTNLGSSLRSLALRFAAIAGSIISIKKIVEVSDELTQITARIGLINDGLQSTGELTNQIFEAANRSRGTYKTMAELVARIGTNAQGAFENSSQIVQFAELVQKQLVLSGSTVREAENTTLQLSQALASGVLRGDELRTVFEDVPILMKLISNEMKVPVGQLRDIAAEGKITADIVKNAVLNNADYINAQFEGIPITWGQAMTQFKNSSLQAFQPFLQGLNSVANSPLFEKIQEKLTGIIRSMAQISNEFMSGIVWFFGGSNNKYQHEDTDITATTDAEDEDTAATDKNTEAKKKNAKATNAQVKASAKYAASLLSIDQIHTLSGSAAEVSEDGGSGGSSTKNITDEEDAVDDLTASYAQLDTTVKGFEETISNPGRFTKFFEKLKEGSEKVKSFIGDLKAAYNDGGLEGAAAFLGKAGQDGIGKLAEWLAGTGFGTKAGEALNAVQTFTKNLFGEPNKWKDLGASIGGQIADAFDTWKPEDFAAAFTNFFSSMFNFLDGMVQETPWGDIGEKIGFAITDINYHEIFMRFCDLLGDAFVGLAEFIWGIIKGAFNNIADKMENSLGKTFANILIDNTTLGFLLNGTARERKTDKNLMLDSTNIPGYEEEKKQPLRVHIPGYDDSSYYENYIKSGPNGHSRSSHTSYSNSGISTSGSLNTTRNTTMSEYYNRSNSSSTTASNAQLANAVSIGVANAVNSALSKQSQGGEIPIILDGEQIGRVLKKSELIRNTRNNPTFAVT